MMPAKGIALLLVGASALTLVASPLAAQTVEPTPPEAAEPEEILVTARRVNESL